MAFYDWNQDGKKDLMDDYIEYNIYEQVTGENTNNGYTPRGNGISTFGAIVATIGGLFLAAAILALLGGGEDTPMVVTIILWIVCGIGLSLWFDKVGF